MVKDMLFHDQTLFMNPEVFDFDYIPEEFMFRGDQMQEIAACLKPAISGKRPINCMLNGKPATGKTTSIKLIFDQLKGDNNIVLVHLNCRICNTTFRFYSEIYRSLFGYTPPDSGVPVNTIYQKIFKVLKSEKKVLIVALDDAVFLEDCDEIIYQLLRANEIFSGVKVGLIVVLSEKEKYVIEDKSVSVFRPSVIDYFPYSENEIFEILMMRVKTGFYRGVIEENIIRKIAEYSVKQDLRFGIELLRQCGIEAENKSSKKILYEHLEKAFSKILKKNEDLGKSKLDKNEEIVLKILDSKKYGSGDLYKLFGKKVNMSYTSFYRLIDKLKKKKLIGVEEKEGRDGRGRTRVIRKL